jgi:hypothetical protein
MVFQRRVLFSISFYVGHFLPCHPSKSALQIKKGVRPPQWSLLAGALDGPTAKLVALDFGQPHLI